MGDEAVTLLDSIKSSLHYLKSIRAKADISCQVLLPDSDSFTRMWYDTINLSSDGIKPGVEQVMVTQLFLDVLTATHKSSRGLWMIRRIEEILGLIFNADIALFGLYESSCLRDVLAETRGFLAIGIHGEHPQRHRAHIADSV